MIVIAASGPIMRRSTLLRKRRRLRIKAGSCIYLMAIHDVDIVAPNHHPNMHHLHERYFPLPQHTAHE